MAASALRMVFEERSMEETYTPVSRSPQVAESPTFAEQEVLERAITKLVLFGRQVGVDPDQMIMLLESGMSMGELLEYLAARSGVSCSD